MNYKFLSFIISIILVAGCVSPTGQVAAKSSDDVKVFTIQSFSGMADGKMRPQFSLREITVSKGDKVRILVNATSGKHDFTLDEYNVKEETPAGSITVIEFTADKDGEFVYYCSKLGHRDLGQWGTLKVIGQA